MKKIITFFVKFFLSLILLMMIFWIIIIGTLQTELGQQWAFQQVTHYVEQRTQTQIQVKKFHFSFPLHLSLEEVVILQNERPMLSIQQFDLCCSSTTLLQGRLIFSKMQASNIHIFELPQSSIHSSVASWDVPLLPFYLKFEHLDIQDLKIDPIVVHALHLPPKIENILNHTSLNVQGVISNNPFKSALTAHLLLTAQDEQLNIAPFSLGVDTQNHQLSFSFHLNPSLQQLQSDLPADAKAHLALYATAPISTWQSFMQHSSQEIEPIEGHFKLTLDAIPPDSSLLSTFVGPQTVMRGQYLLKSKEAIELLDMKIDHPTFWLEGKGIFTSNLSIDQGYFKGKIYHLEEFQAWLKQDIAGQLAFEGNVMGSLQSPTFNFQIESPQLIIANQIFQNIHSTLQTAPQQSSLQGFFTLLFDYQSIPWQAASAFDWNHDQKTLSFSQLQMEAMHSHLKGEMTCSLPQSLWNGFVEAQVDDLNDVSRFLPIPLHGEGVFKLQLSAFSDSDQKKQQVMQGEFIGKSLRWMDGQAQQLVLNLHLTPFNQLSTEWKAQEIQWQGVQLQELTGNTTIDLAQTQWPFQLHGKGRWKEDLLFDAEGAWHYQEDVLHIHAQQLKGRFGPYPFQLKQPLHLIKQTHDIQLTGLWLRWGEAEIQATLHRDQQSVLADFKTNAVPSELFHFIVPNLPLTGRATFAGHLEGSLSQPKGQFQIDLHHMQVIEDVFAQKPFITGKLLLDLNEKGIQVKSNLNGIGHGPLRIAGQLPISLSLEPFNFAISRQLPFDLALQAEGELDPYLHLFYNDITNLSGHTQIALQLSGQMTAPQIKGHIHLTNGSYESLSTGAIYRNIQAHLEGDGSKLLLTQFTARDNKNGEISATGVVHLDANHQFPFEFQIHPARIFILDSDYAAISASGRLSLIGNTKKSKLQGELRVDQAAIHLEEALPGQIKNIDIKYINLAQGERLPNYLEKQEKNSALELDIKLNAPGNVLIQGNHLKSEWKGILAVTGTPGNPQLHGDLYITKGEYDLNGKIFNLNQGNIHFAGAPGKKTSLYIVASKEIDRITAEMIVKGPVNKPVISFRSNPPLSQREVLSYILFNRGISGITVDQGEQLSESFISLNSSDQPKSNDDFLSRLRNNIGIDHLDFIANDNKENKDFALQAGKHITENVMISINQSMTSLSPVIAVEAKLRKNLKVQAETGVSGDAPIRMSIKWKKDY